VNAVSILVLPIFRFEVKYAKFTHAWAIQIIHEFKIASESPSTGPRYGDWRSPRTGYRHGDWRLRMRRRHNLFVSSPAPIIQNATVTGQYNVVLTSTN